MIVDAVAFCSTKEDNNWKLKGYERERIRQEERIDSDWLLQERVDERRRWSEDQRFQMFMMMTMKPQPHSSFSSNEAPTSQLCQDQVRECKVS